MCLTNRILLPHRAWVRQETLLPDLTESKVSITTQASFCLLSAPLKDGSQHLAGGLSLTLCCFLALKATQTELLELRRKYDEEAASK